MHAKLERMNKEEEERDKGEKEQIRCDPLAEEGKSQKQRTLFTTNKSVLPIGTTQQRHERQEPAQNYTISTIIRLPSTTHPSLVITASCAW